MASPIQLRRTPRRRWDGPVVVWWSVLAEQFADRCACQHDHDGCLSGELGPSEAILTGRSLDRPESINSHVPEGPLQVREVRAVRCGALSEWASGHEHRSPSGEA